VAILTTTSCSLEKKLAREFVKNSSQYNAMVLTPEIIYKNNLNTHIVDSLNITDEDERYSMLWEQSYFLKNIDDSLFIANYILGYKSELKSYGVNVFGNYNSADFFSLDSNAFMINIAQFEIEEEDFFYRDEAEIYDYVYFHDHLLKAVNINSWFEINKLNDNEQSQNMFYATNTITDDLNSSFDYNVFTGKVEYTQELDSLSIGKIYEYGYLIGRIYATYTFDFMMNRYIEQQKGIKTRKSDLLRYNPNNGSFFYSGENRFISLDE
jgi:hypothetical protein